MEVETSGKIEKKAFPNLRRYSEKDIEKILSNKLGEKYSRYRERWNNADYDNIPSFPVHIDFELIDQCNQRCVMCPRNSKSHPDINYSLNRGTVFDFEKYKKIIDEGIDKGLMSINLGAFSEPLMNKKVFEMIKYAQEKGILDSRLITNGLLLDKYKDDIFSSGLVNLFFSIDAFSEEKYRAIRGKGFEKVKKNLLSIIERKKKRSSLLPIIRVSFLDMKNNREEKKHFIEFWKDKVDLIDIQVFDNFNVNILNSFDKTKEKKWSCKSPVARVAILANGDILPCCNFFGINVPVGNIYSQSLEEAWKSDEMKKIREGILKDNLDNCSICQRIGE